MKFNYSFFTCLGPWICSSPYSDTCSMFWSLNVLFQPLFLYLLYVLVLEWVFPALILILVLCFSPWMCSSPYSDTCSMFWSLNVFQPLFLLLYFFFVLDFEFVLILFSGTWSVASLVVPHLTISVFGSSCNYVFFCLILAPLFLFSFLGNPN